MNTALPEMLHCFNGGGGGGFYFDQGIGEVVVGGAMKPDPGMENGWDDDLGRIVLNYSKPETVPATGNSKKRKAEKAQTTEEKPEEKKMKVGAEEESKSTTTTTGSSNSNNNTNNKNAKSEAVAPKPDYIHVRARRGQATDSHSLAERVRREKISERMKYLQDLVPGCNKITGKAGMLDEIINYVQSLQRQVEFLSMKLAAINSTLHFDINGFVTKEIFPACPATFRTMNSTHLQFNPVVSMLDTFLEPLSSLSCLNQVTWEEGLELCMEYQQGRPTPTPTPFTFTPQTFAGLLEAGHVKLEM